MVRDTAAPRQSIFSHTLTVPFLLALLQLALQMAFHGRYGYFRDELYYIACSKHLAFGYVDQPPLSIAILWVSRMLLGDSLHAIRFLPAVTGAAVVVLAAMMARLLGGARSAQSLASLSVVAAHTLIGHGRTFSMNPFDVLFWTLAGYIVILLLSTDRPKLWLLFGLVVGLGLMNKYSIGFMVIGLVAGLLLTRQRRQLATIWFWLGAAIAGVVFLPHVIWEIVNGFPSLEFMRNAAETKNVHLGLLGFLGGQLRDMNYLNAPLWIGGVYFFYTHQEGRFRPLAWMFVIVVAIMVAGNAKVYYLSAIFPIFLAGGAVLFEGILQRKSFRPVKPVYVGLLALLAVVILPFAVPVIPVEQFIRYERFLGQMPRAEERIGVGDLPQYYADQFGWEEMVDTLASVYRRLTPGEQSKCLLFVRNYGEAGAVDFFGKKYGLPHASCAHNSYWMWGPGEQTGDISIIIGNSRTLEDNLADLRRRWKYVELAATTHALHCMPYENGRMIFICKGMNTTFQQLWPHERIYI